MSKQAVNEINDGRYELRNFEFPNRPGQILQFFVREDEVIDEGDRKIVVDGTSVDDVIKVVIDRIYTLDMQNPSFENEDAIASLNDALQHLRDRRKRVAAEKESKKPRNIPWDELMGMIDSHDSLSIELYGATTEISDKLVLANKSGEIAMRMQHYEPSADTTYHWYFKKCDNCDLITLENGQFTLIDDDGEGWVITLND